MRGEKVEGGREWGRKDPLSFSICGAHILTSPAGWGAEVWERRVGLAMLPLGMGFGSPTPFCARCPGLSCPAEEASLL